MVGLVRTTTVSDAPPEEKAELGGMRAVSMVARGIGRTYEGGSPCDCTEEWPDPVGAAES